MEILVYIVHVVVPLAAVLLIGALLGGSEKEE